MLSSSDSILNFLCVWVSAFPNAEPGLSKEDLSLEDKVLIKNMMDRNSINMTSIRLSLIIFLFICMELGLFFIIKRL